MLLAQSLRDHRVKAFESKERQMIVASESPLSTLITGSVVVAGDAEWDSARATFNLLD